MNKLLVSLIFTGLMTIQGSLVQSVAQSVEKNVIGTFTEAEMSRWQEHSFKKNTNYQLNGNVLVASCEDQASVFFREVSIDLTKTPMLHWSWRVDTVRPELEDTIKAGDDYAVRIYVVNGAKSIFSWRAKAVNYVWANSQPKGSTWPSAYTNNDIMVAVQSGQPIEPNKWVHEVRNVREDFKNYFDKDITSIDSVAIMTDCDNSKRPATGYYRDIWFSAE